MSRANKVLHVFPSHAWGGAEIYALQLAYEQQLRGHDTLFWLKAESPMAKEAKKLGLRVVEEALGSRIDLGAFSRILRLIKKENISHVHLHWSGGLWTFAPLKRLLGVKLIYHVHMFMKHSKKDPLHWFLYQQLDAVIVAGERAKLAVLKTLPVKKKSVFVCPYGMDFKKYENVKAKIISGFSEENFVFGMFARIDKQKGVLEFIKAFERLEKKHPQVRAVIVGDPTLSEKDPEEYNRQVDALITQPHLCRKIIKMGFQKEYLSFMKSCEVLVAPSYHESYSLILLDAFILGVSVISTDSGGTPDIVTPDRGWLVSPRSVDSLAMAMEAALVPGVLESRRVSAQRYVLREHDFSHVVEIINKIYLGTYL